MLRTNTDYTSRVLTDTELPKFKLNAACINLEDKEENMEFITDEWSDFLHVQRVVASGPHVQSYTDLLSRIWARKEALRFPLVVMEDDVFRRNNFTEYWNELLNLHNCDYVTFDPIFIEIVQEEIHPKFVSLLQHRASGFIVYYKKFFNRFETAKDISRIAGDPIDCNLTHNSEFVKYTPKRQVCRQIVSKYSYTSERDTSNTHVYHYDTTERD